MRKIISIWKYYTDRRFSTFAGTLTYFLLMSIAPFMLWLTLVLGRVDISRFLNMRLLEGVAPILRYMKSSAESAAGGAGIILLATSLYSSTNFFYHLRRSGEIIYDGSSKKGGIKLRLLSLLLIAATIILVALAAAISVVGTAFMETILPTVLSDAISIVFMTALMFSVAMILNIFACPDGMKISEAVPGSLLTTALWLVFAIGFSVYLMFATPEKLYGKIASLIVFLLWCYIMMSCLIIGIINNGRYKKQRVFPEGILFIRHFNF